MQKQDKGKSHIYTRWLMDLSPGLEGTSRDRSDLELMEAEGTARVGIQPQKWCSQSLALRREEEE